MKKFILIVVVLLVLLGLSVLLKGNQPTAPVAEEAVVDTMVDVNDNDIIVVDTEPVVEDVAPEGDVVDVVEDNPEATADEGETFVEE